MDSKRRANCCSLWTYWYANNIVDCVNENKGIMDEKMIEDMNTDSLRDEKMLHKFQSKLLQNHEEWQKSHPGQKATEEFYGFTLSAIRHTFGCQFVTVAVLALFAEFFALMATFMIRYLAQYLMDDEAEPNDAVIYLSIFGVCVLMSVTIRNFYIYYGYFMSLEIRKVLIAAMYDKVAALSMRSLTETNSGKLITLVSSDIFTLERPLSMAPFGLAAPIINLYCYMLIWYVAGWPYAIIVGCMWIVTYFLQMCTANLQKRMKTSEAMRNDERMKLINDMVTGIRTIKSYAWENHYSKKVRGQRAEQMTYIFWLNLVGSLGFSLF